MKQIILTQGKIALVDDEDYTVLVQYRWCVKYDPSIDTWYAVSRTPRPEHKQILMHRMVLHLTNPSEFVDHIDHNGLNNCRSNLRACCNKQNQHNRRKVKNKTSEYKGVAWIKTHKKWRATIMEKGKNRFLGYFNTEKEAAKAYNEKALEMFGAFALLNKI